MAGHRDHALDEKLEAWARWVVRGGRYLSGGGGGATMLARWMDSKGDIQFGSGGSKPPVVTLEERIDDVVGEVRRADELNADILHMEYAANWEEVAERRGIRDYDPAGCGQRETAIALGISHATYKRRLEAVRSQIKAAITRSR